MNKKTNYIYYIELGIMVILFFGLIRFSKEFEFAKNLKPDTSEDKILMIIGIIIMVHIVLVVHELGHVITGLVQGFSFQLFVVGLLGIKKEEEKIKVYLNKNIGYYGGVASTLPIEDSKDNLKKYARVILAGPIASVLFAIVCLFAVNYLGKPFGMIAYTGAITSIGIFFATTIPSKSGMFFTDRKRFQRLVTPGKEQEIELAILKILGNYAKDDSYKNIDKKEIETLISDDNPSMKYYGLYNMICWQIEHQGEVEEEIKKEYETVSKEMNKSMVDAFNKEIQKYSEKVKIDINKIR